MKPFSIMLLAGALFIAVGCLTPHWMSFGYEDNQFHSGLYSAVSCRGDEGCETELIVKYLGRGGGMSGPLSILLGLLLLLGGLGTVVINAISGFATMTRRGPVFVSMIMSAVLGLVALMHLGIGHGLTHPGSWGYSLYLFFLGVGLSVAGALMAMGVYPAAQRMMYGMPGMMPGMPGMPGMPMMPQQGYQQAMLVQQQQYAQLQQMQYAQMQQQQQQQFQQPAPQMQQQQQQQQQQAQAQPNCNQCGGPTVWNGQVGKLFCQPCNRFLV